MSQTTRLADYRNNNLQTTNSPSIFFFYMCVGLAPKRNVAYGSALFSKIRGKQFVENGLIFNSWKTRSPLAQCQIPSSPAHKYKSSTTNIQERMPPILYVQLSSFRERSAPWRRTRRQRREVDQSAGAEENKAPARRGVYRTRARRGSADSACKPSAYLNHSRVQI